MDGLMDGATQWTTPLTGLVCFAMDCIFRKLVVVFGREGAGVSPEILESAAERVYYPIHGFTDSLNVSVSVALILDTITW